MEPRRLLASVGGLVSAGPGVGQEAFTVYADLNNNQVPDEGEPSAVATAGEPYTLDGVPGGTDSPVLIRLAPQLGWAVTSPTEGYQSVQFSDDSGSASGVDFSVVVADTVSGTVRGDGWGVGNVPVFVDDNGDGSPDDGEPTAVTNWDGTYTLGPLQPGASHSLLAVMQTGWHQTQPVANGPTGTQSVFVPYDGTPITGADFDFESDDTGAVAGSVFADLDANGVRTANEPPLDGWTVYVDSNFNGQLDDGERWVQTDGDGNYEIDGLLLNHCHLIRVVPRPGWTVTMPFGSEQWPWVDGYSPVATGVDFGAYAVASISGTVRRYDPATSGGSTGLGVAGVPVFDDLNGDGVPDAGDVTAVTNASGKYTLSGVPFSADQKVYAVPWGTWQQSLPAGGAPLSVTVTTAAPAVTGADFGMDAAAGTISGSAFDDPSGDFAASGGDPAAAGAGLAGRTVFLDENGNGYFDEGEPSAVTGDDGSYTINSAPLYTCAAVRLLGQDGWAQTFPSPDSGIWVYLTGVDPDAAGVNFGQSQFGTIGGTVYDDADADGARGAGEAGVAGITVYDDFNGNHLLDDGEPATVTGPDGGYTLTGLAIGPGASHQVRVLGQAGWSQTDPAYGDARWVTLYDYGTGINLTQAGGADLGMTTATPGVVRGTVYNDANADGARQGAESGLDGRTVYDDANGDGQWEDGEASAVTAADGSFVLSGLTVAAVHSLRVVPVAGWAPTSVQYLGYGDPPPLGVMQVYLAASAHDADGVDFGQRTLPAPQNLSATPASTSEIDLSWSNPDPTTGIIVQRSGDGGATWASLNATPLPPETTGYPDGGLAPGSHMFYRLVAVTADGAASEPSESAEATSLLPPPPPPVTGVTAVPQSDGSVDLSWSNDPSGDADAIEIDMSTDGGTTYDPLDVIDPASTSYQTPSLVPETAYVFRVRPLNVGGPAADATAGATTPIAEPFDVTAQAESDGSVDVTWSGFPYEVVSGFTVLRSTDGVHFTPVGQVDGATDWFQDATAQSGASYSYEVMAVQATPPPGVPPTSAPSAAAPAAPAPVSTPTLAGGATATVGSDYSVGVTVPAIPNELYVDWGDGSPPQIVPAPAAGTVPPYSMSITHRFQKAGTFTVQATAYGVPAGTSTTGVATSNKLSVTALAARTITLGGPATASPDAPYPLTFSASGDAPITKWQINWGDGSAPALPTLPAASASHQFAKAAGIVSRTVTVTAWDANAPAAGYSATKTVTVGYFNDFDAPQGWAGGFTGGRKAWANDSTGKNSFLGPFGADGTELTMQNVPQHTGLSVSFDVLELNTWDAVPFQVTDAATGKVVFSSGNLTNIASNDAPDYDNDQQGPQPQYGAPTNLKDTAFHVSFDFAHTADQLDLKLTAPGLTSPGAFGIDNVSVTSIAAGAADSLTVTDSTDPTNSQTSTGDSVPNLYVQQGANGSANVRLHAVTDLQGSADSQGQADMSKARWRVTGILQGTQQGTFAAGDPTVTLTPGSDQNRAFKVTEWYDADGDGLRGSNEKEHSVWVNVFTLQLTEDGTAINGTATSPVTKIIGQPINLGVELGSGVLSPPTLSCQWAIPGTVVKDYTQTPTQGFVTDLRDADLTPPKPTLSFYWTAPLSPATVSCVVHIGGAACAVSCVFNVISPTLSFTTVNERHKPMVGDGTGMYYPQWPQNSVALAYADLDKRTPGIDWSDTVVAPAGGAGDLATIQLLDPHDYSALNLNGTKSFTTANTKSPSGDRWILDGAPGASFPHYSGTFSPIGSGGTAKSVGKDAPATLLTGRNDGLYKVLRFDRFQDYMMYRPAGGIWVTLGQFTWDWYGFAIESKPGKWDLYGKAGSSQTPAVSSSALPQWATAWPIFPQNAPTTAW